VTSSLPVPHHCNFMCTWNAAEHLLHLDVRFQLRCCAHCLVTCMDCAVLGCGLGSEPLVVDGVAPSHPYFSGVGWSRRIEGSNPSFQPDRSTKERPSFREPERTPFSPEGNEGRRSPLLSSTPIAPLGPLLLLPPPSSPPARRRPRRNPPGILAPSPWG